ncbi:MAG: ABC transporter permease [Propionibacteriaceae bacterium]|jgi:ABC-type transport system involved in multi-copper enzyme maturation permease subunit|nr:ABC transporter permease [Propionibacteriaceae bacterium]
MNTWSFSFRGLRTVTELELKQRVRSRRWAVGLLVWFCFIGLVTTLILITAFTTTTGANASERSGIAATAFGVITLFVLAMGLIIAPTFTATSLNGDRHSGTLAVLQATRLSALEIAAGKLVGAWLVAGLFLVVALPFLLLTMTLGRLSVWAVLTCFLVIVFEVAIVCAIGLGWSALMQRTSASTVMTYLTVFFLSALTVVFTVLMIPFAQEENATVHTWRLSPADEAAWDSDLSAYIDELYEAGLEEVINNRWGDYEEWPTDAPLPPVERCQWIETNSRDVTHSERFWWMLVLNPVVIMADIVPTGGATTEPTLGGYNSPVSSSGDIFLTLKTLLRGITLPPDMIVERCQSLYNNIRNVEIDWRVNPPTITANDGTELPTAEVPAEIQAERERSEDQRALEDGHAYWPWGIAGNLLLAGVFFTIAVRRLRIPYATLAPGTRVA